MKLKPLKPLLGPGHPGQSPFTPPPWMHWEEVRSYVDRNRLAFASAGGVLVVVLAFTILYVRHQRGVAERSAAMFRDASNLYAYRVPPPDAEGMPLVGSDEEKYQRAGQAFQQLADAYPGARLAPLALYYAGNCRFKLKQYSGALDAFEQFLARFPRHALVGSAHVAKGDCLEQLGKFPEAYQAYQLASSGEGPQAAEAKLGMARCLLKIAETDRNRWGEAVDLLNRLAAEKDGYGAKPSRAVRKLLADLSTKAPGK